MWLLKVLTNRNFILLYKSKNNKIFNWKVGLEKKTFNYIQITCMVGLVGMDTLDRIY